MNEFMLAARLITESTRLLGHMNELRTTKRRGARSLVEQQSHDCANLIINCASDLYLAIGDAYLSR